MSTALAERSWCVVVPHHAQGARLARRRLATELACHLSPTLLSDTIAVRLPGVLGGTVLDGADHTGVHKHAGSG